MSGFESVVGVNPWTALITFCNMIISFLILKKFFFKPIKGMIDSRQKEIDDKYDAADRAKDEAEALKADYQKNLANVKSEYEQILRDATTRAQKREEEIIAAANASAEAIRKKATTDIAREKKEALNEVKNEISCIAMEIASKVVQKEITAEDHQHLVEEFIEKIGEKA